jgi:lipoic acid synthetase
MEKIPFYVKKRVSSNDEFLYMKNLLKEYGVNTVCESAVCPNIYECFGKKYASFMILGNICTRNCKFCGVSKGKPEKVDEKEPEKIAGIVKKLKMKYVVITSVTRDDLPDAGANHYAKVTEAIKRISPETKIELLIPDFKGDLNFLKIVFNSRPDIISHNIETLPSLYPIIRPRSNYKISMEVLSEIKKNGFITKSGFMLGLGEKEEEIFKLMEEILNKGCDILVVGQYLKPAKNGYEVRKFYTEDFFLKIKEYGLKIGYKKVFSGIFYRSSYLAENSI